LLASLCLTYVGWPQTRKKPGILGEFSEPGKHVEISGSSVQLQGKIITSKIILV